MFPEVSGIIRQFSRQTGITDPRVDNWLRETEYPKILRRGLEREYYFTRPENEGYWVRYPADRAQLKCWYHSWWQPEMFARQVRFQERLDPPLGEWCYDEKHHGWYRMFTVDRRVLAEHDVGRYYEYMSKYFGDDLEMQVKKVDRKVLRGWGVMS